MTLRGMKAIRLKNKACYVVTLDPHSSSLITITTLHTPHYLHFNSLDFVVLYSLIIGETTNSDQTSNTSNAAERLCSVGVWWDQSTLRRVHQHHMSSFFFSFLNINKIKNYHKICFNNRRNYLFIKIMIIEIYKYTARYDKIKDYYL